MRHKLYSELFSGRKTALILFVFLFAFSPSVSASDAADPAINGNAAELIGFIIILIGTLIWLIALIARCIMLEKCGEKGWKIIIPFFGRYLEYKTYWNGKFFRIGLGLQVLLIMIVTAVYYTENKVILGILILLMFGSIIGIAVVRTKLRMNTLEIFDFNRKLGLLELAGLGFISDFICGFSGRVKKTPVNPDISNILQEHIDNWE